MSGRGSSRRARRSAHNPTREQVALIRRHRRQVESFRAAVEDLEREFDGRLLSNTERNIRRNTRSANSRWGAVKRRYQAALEDVYDKRADASAYYMELVREGLADSENVKTDRKNFETFEKNLRDHRINWQLVIPIQRPRTAQQPA
jgi:hypothetical protein